MRHGITTFVTDEGIAPGELGVAVEERGFDALFVAEHSHVPVSRETPYPAGGELPRVYYRALDPFVALTAVAAATDRLLIGTAVSILVQRDVIHTAKEVASLDFLSGGRVLFGVGVGWNREEMRDHGTDPRTRGALLDEQLAAMQAIWTQEVAEYHGEHVEFEPMYAWPKPVQQPHPPVYVGGGPVAAARAVRFGFGWIPNGVPDAAAVPEQVATAGGVPITVSPVRRDRAILEAYAEAGVERVSFLLGTRGRDETLRSLDELAALVDGIR